MVTVFKLLRTNLNSTIPDTNDNNNIFNLHLLQQMKELLTCSILTIIIKTFSYYIFLCDLIQLIDSIGQYSISCRRKLRMRIVVDIIQVIHYKLNLVLVSNSSRE